MPILGTSSYRATPRFGTGAAPSAIAMGEAANYVTTQDRNAVGVLGGIAGLGAVDLVDTVASSIPGISSALGIERGQVNRNFMNALDVPGVSDFYHDYKGGIEAASGVYGIVAAELLTRKLTAPAGAFMGALSKVPYVRRIAALDAQYANAMANVRAVDMNLAARGALGAEQYTGRTVIDANLFDPITGGFLTASKSLKRDTAVFKARGLGFLSGAKNAAFTEATMAVTLNQNGFLYDDSAAQNMTWMAFGLGIGGAAEWLHGAYQIRKFVNSDEIKRAFVGALDPGVQEESRLLWHGKSVSPEAKSEGFLGGIFTDRATNLFVNARTLTESTNEGTVEALELAANRSRLATQHLQLGREELQKVTTKGISSNGYTRFSLDAPGYGNHADMMTHRDPAWMYGVEQVGGVADDTTAAAIHDHHMTRLQERIDAAEEQLGAHIDAGEMDKADEVGRYISRLEYESNLTPMAAIDGELMPLSEAEAFAGFKEPGANISFNASDRVKDSVKGEVKGAFKKGDDHGLYSIKSESPAPSVTLGTDFIYHIPGKGKTMANADHYDVMRLYRLADRALDKMAKFAGSHIVPKNADWFQLDMAEELLRRTEGRAKVVFPEGMTRDTARIESLLQKSKLVKQWDKVESRAALKAEEAGKTYEGQLSKLRLRLNLPRLTAYERGILGDEAEHPVEALLRGMSYVPEDEIRNMNITQVQEAMGKSKRVGDLAPVQPSDLEDMGSSFKFMTDDKGMPVKPLILYKRPFKTAEWTTEHNAERLAAAKMHTVSVMTDGQAAPMTKALTDSMLQSPDFQAATRTHELMDTQIQGSIASGAAPQTQRGAFGKAFISSNQRDRDNIILLGATRVRDAVNRMARDFMKSAIEKEMGGTLATLASPRNATSKLLLNQFHSFRAGWDIAPEATRRADGYHSFTLRPSADNQERFREMFGRDMTKNQVLLAPNGKEVVLDGMGMEIQQRFNRVSEAIRLEKNTLLRANGRPEIAQLDWYVPPPNTNGKFIGFTVGPDNQPIRGMTVVADTEAEFTQARAQILKRIEGLGLGYQFRTQESIREFANVWDKVMMDFINPGTTAVQSNKRGAGKLTGSVIKTDAFADSLKYLTDNFLEHSNDVVGTLLREQINSAKARSAISSQLVKNNAAASVEAKTRNVYDFYIENLTGRSKLNNGSFVGRFYNSIEGPLDKFLAEATPGVANVWHATHEWVNKITPWSKSEQARKDFDALASRLGQYMPFENAPEMAERMGLGTTPPTLASMGGKLNAFSAAVLLRIAEVAHPIMNLSGIVNASPAIIRSFQPMRGETQEAFAKRIGHMANIFDIKEGLSIGVPDMTKISGRAFKRAWSREAHADYDFMVRRGYLSQEVAEFHRQFGAIDTPGFWNRFFNGDPNSKSKLAQKGLVGWASVLSDKSEDFSRSWGHMIGLELADSLGIVSKEARHSFAHDVANKMIANYSPANRPEVFQGALGAPIGLFQSFVMNYYERIFRHIETKDYKSLMTQLGTQAGLFGVTSIPGWQAVNAVFSHDDKDAESGIWRRLGGNAGDLVGHGVLANIPKLFGAPGVDLYSRGDVSIRQLQIQDLDSISGIINSTVPAVNVAGKVYRGLVEGVNMFMGNNPGASRQQLAEIMSNMLANRPISGLIEQTMAGGYDTDKSGQLVHETRGAMETAYRLLGLRSERQSEELRAFYASKNAMTHKAANDEQLKLYTRAMIRDNRMDELPGVFQQYLSNGGDPRHFRRWFKSTYIAATNTRGERALEKAMKSGEMEDVIRFLDAGVTVNDDEKVGDANNLYVANTAAEEPLTQEPQF